MIIKGVEYTTLLCQPIILRVSIYVDFNSTCVGDTRNRCLYL